MAMHVQAFARRALVALGATAAVISFATQSNAEDEGMHRAEFGVAVGPIWHTAKDGASENPRGVTYDTGFGQTVFARIPLTPWLRIGPFYQRSYHSLNMPKGAVDVPGANVDLDSLLAFTIGGRIEPMIRPTKKLQVWMSIGYSWSRMSAPRMKVASSNRTYTVMEREGVFLSVPFGLGLAYEVIPRWLTVHAETTWGIDYSESGSLFEATQYVDSNGQVGHAPGFPMIKHSISQMFGFALLL